MPTPLPGQTPEQAGKHPENAPVSDLHRRYPDLLGARVAMLRTAEAARPDQGDSCYLNLSWANFNE